MKSFTMKIADVIKEKIESTSIVKPMFSQQKPGNSLINKEYYEDKLARVRESKNEELQQYAIITKNHFRREYENVLAEIKEKYKKNILEVKQECLTLKEIVQNRDALVNKLCTIISDMEVYMTKTRILKNKHNEKKVKKNTKDNDEAPLDANFYLMNIYNLTLQIDSLKETCKLYQKDIETLNGKTKVIRDQHVKTENLLKNEISKLHEQLKQKDLEFDYKVKQFHAE